MSQEARGKKESTFSMVLTEHYTERKPEIGGLSRSVCRLMVLVLLVSAGCSRQADHGTTGNGKGTAKTERRFLSIGTAPPGGAFFVVGGAIAEVLAAHTSSDGWHVSSEATKGTQENVRRLDKGELDFALANAAITYFAVRGEDKWEKEYPIRTVMTLAPNVAFFVTPQSSGIESITDLRGKRVVLGPAGAGFEHFIAPILEAHGLAYEDLNALHDTQAGAVALLADRSADAAFLGGAVPTASITQACASRQIRFIPFTAEAKDSLVSAYSFFGKKTVPANTYRGHPEDFHALNVGNMLLVTSSGVDEDTVYRVTKTLFENAKEIIDRHPAGRAINPKNAIRDTGTPFHDGAVRYFKEIGIWPVH